MNQTIDTFDVLSDYLGVGCGRTPHKVGEEIRSRSQYHPWVEFLIRDRPCRHKFEVAFLVETHSGTFRAANFVNLSEKFRRLLGLDQFGVREESPTSFKQFKRQIRKEEERDGVKLTAEPQNTCFRVIAEYDIPAHYRRLPYDHEQAKSRIGVPEICGIDIGGMAESGEAIGPIILPFPFRGEELDQALSHLEKGFEFYWKLNHSHWFILESPHRKEYVFRDTEGQGPVWLRKAPRSKNIKGLAKLFCRDCYPGLYEEQVRGASEDQRSFKRLKRNGRTFLRRWPYGSFTGFMETNWKIAEARPEDLFPMEELIWQAES